MTIHLRPRYAVAVLALALAPSAAAAQSVSASEHFDRGVHLSSEGDMRGALTEFRAAYDASQNPEVLFNLAATHENLNEYVEARELIERYQRLAPPSAVARHRAEIVAALARLNARIGIIALTTDVPEATVEVDGVARREWRDGIPVSVGRRRVTVTAPGREAFRAEVDVAGGQRAAVAATLPRTRSTIQVACELAGASVRVDGQEVARTPVESPLSVTEGRHVIEVAHPGYETFRAEVEASGVGARVAATLRWAEPVPEAEGAHLVLRVSEPGAHATLDGHRVPMDGSMAVPPGRHTLRVEREEFLPVLRSVDLPAGRPTRLDLRLEPTPAHRAEVEGRSRRMRTAGWLALGIGAPVAIGGAIWLGLAVPQYTSSLNARDANDVVIAQCESGTVSCPPERSRAALDDNIAIEARIDGELTAAVVSGVLTGVGLVGAITGLVLLVNAPPGDRFERAPTWYLGLSPGGAGVSGRF